MNISALRQVAKGISRVSSPLKDLRSSPEFEQLAQRVKEGPTVKP